MKRTVLLLLVVVGIMMAGAPEAQAGKLRSSVAPSWSGGNTTSPDGKELEPDPDQVLYMRGKVVSVGSGVITVEYFDYKTLKDVKMKFKVDSKTVLNGVSALASLKAGMQVSIDYQVDKRGNAVAKTIVLNADGESDWSFGK